MIELIMITSDPRFLERARKLAKVIEKLVSAGGSAPIPALPKPRPGQVLSTVRLILLEHPEGLQTYEVRKLVEERLGRQLPRSTVKALLAEHEEFERVGRGRYRVRV